MMKTATQNPQHKTHPMFLVAATAVTLASLAGIASMAGWLPGNQPAAIPPAPLALAAPNLLPPAQAPAINAEKAATLNIPAGSSITVNPTNERPAHRAATPRKLAAPTPAPASSPAPAPLNDASPHYSYRGATPVSTAPANDSGIDVENGRQVPPLCRDCGTVEHIREIAQEGQGSGLGAIAGGVLGGLLGSQIGNGSGRKVATVAGVVGGAYAGHNVEKNTRSSQQFEITVRLDDGSMRTITETRQAGWRTGDRVRISENHLASL
jgi:outer membrane lipoprotein SlyB